MKFQYYWDKDLFEALLRYRMRPFLAEIIVAAQGVEDDMGNPADIQKLVQRMQRAHSLTDRAVNSGSKGDAVMDAFEATLNRYDDHFTKIKEYDAQIQAMMQVTGNGGPPLSDTFQPAPTAAPANAPAKPAVDHDPTTGDPLK